MSCTDTSTTNLTEIKQAGGPSRKGDIQHWDLIQRCSRQSSAPGSSSAVGTRMELSWQHPLITHKANGLLQKLQNKEDHCPPLLGTGETISKLEIPLFGSRHSTLPQFLDPFLWPKLPITEIQHWHRAQQTQPGAQQRDWGQAPNVDKGEEKKKAKKSPRMYHWKHCFN